MFTILGADGKEYGPVPAEKILAWLKARRADLKTKARRDGETEWKTLGDFAEFAATPATDPSEATPPPSAGAVPGSPAADPLTDPDAVLARAMPLDIFGCVQRGWATALANFWPILGVSLLVGLCAFVTSAIPILGIVTGLVLNGVFYGGLYYYVLKKVRGEPTEIGDAFSGFSVCFGQLVLASIVVVVLVMLGFLLLILPGIYLAVCWMFTFLLVREKGMEFWPAMELGRRVVTAQWFRVFGLLLLVMVMVFALLAVPVGLMIMSGVASHGHAPNLIFLALGAMSATVIGLALSPFLYSILVHAYEVLFNPRRA